MNIALMNKSDLTNFLGLKRRNDHWKLILDYDSTIVQMESLDVLAKS